MKLTESLTKEIKEHGFADGSKYVSEEQTPIDRYDLADLYESTLWRFAAGEQIQLRKQHPPLSLLGLPVELRLQILQCLLPDRSDIGTRDLSHRRRPNKTIQHWKNAKRGIWHCVPKAKRANKLDEWEETIQSTYTALRDDYEPCYTAIMRVNRQLYAEAAQLVYENRTFHAELWYSEFRIGSRDFQVGFVMDDFSMLESHMRHISSLEITVSCGENFCQLRHEDAEHACEQSGCFRTRTDGIKNMAEFLSKCVGLDCLKIKAQCAEYEEATQRRPAFAKHLRQLEGNVLKLVRPFGMVRNLVWAGIYIVDRPPRDWPHSGAKFHAEIEVMEKQMRGDDPIPERTDFVLTKCAFHSIFTTNLQYRTVMRQQLGLDIDQLQQQCWQACEDGNKTAVLKHHKMLTKAWEEQKRIVEGLLGQIESMALEPQLAASRTLSASRTRKTKANPL